MEYHHWISKERVDEIINKFISSKEKKFQEKAIISMDTAKDIIRVLKPGGGLYGTANFRYWARKRFALKTIEGVTVVCCDNKPVCLKEAIYEIILKAHVECQHKGKESTYKQIHKTRSYLPKSLVQMIVKECIHCNLKKVEFHDIVDLYF